MPAIRNLVVGMMISFAAIGLAYSHYVHFSDLPDVPLTFQQ